MYSNLQIFNHFSKETSQKFIVEDLDSHRDWKLLQIPFGVHEEVVVSVQGLIVELDERRSEGGVDEGTDEDSDGDVSESSGQFVEKEGGSLWWIFLVNPSHIRDNNKIDTRRRKEDVPDHTWQLFQRMMDLKQSYIIHDGYCLCLPG